MSETLTNLLASAAILVGLFFMSVASLGLLRFPDFYLRVHAPTKAATLGLFALVAGLLLAAPETRAIEALLVALFIGTTIPLSAHFLLRGAYRSGLRPEGTQRDEYGNGSAPSAAGSAEENGVELARDPP